MAELIRLGVSIDKMLLKKFDQYLKLKKYSNRSEAIRDMIRKLLAEQSWTSIDAEVAATISIVYDHHKKELLEKLAHVQHDYLNMINSTVHIHMDKSLCLEVLIVQGRAGKVQELADRLSALKGVMFRNFNFVPKNGHCG